MTCTGGLPSRNMKSAMSFRLHTSTRATSWRDGHRVRPVVRRGTGNVRVGSIRRGQRRTGAVPRCRGCGCAVSSREHPGRRSSAVPVQQVDRDGCSAMAARPHTFRCAR